MVAEDKESISSEMFSFSLDDIGRKFSDTCLQDMMENFQNYHSEKIGPGLMTRVIKKLCGERSVSKYPKIY